MKIEIKKEFQETTKIDAVQALRVRAAECVERHLSEPPRSDAPYGDEKPLDLWEAKLCLEIALLFQQTEKKSK